MHDTLAGRSEMLIFDAQESLATHQLSVRALPKANTHAWDLCPSVQLLRGDLRHFVCRDHDWAIH